MSVPQYTTPVFTLTFSEPDLDFTQARDVYVTFRNMWSIITKTGRDLEVSEKSISVHLSQEETSKFKPGEIEIQANWITPSGNRAASEVVKYEISKQLLMEVIE